MSRCPLSDSRIQQLRFSAARGATSWSHALRTAASEGAAKAQEEIDRLSDELAKAQERVQLPRYVCTEENCGHETDNGSDCGECPQCGYRSLTDTW